MFSCLTWLFLFAPHLDQPFVRVALVCVFLALQIAVVLSDHESEEMGQITRGTDSRRKWRGCVPLPWSGDDFLRKQRLLCRVVVRRGSVQRASCEVLCWGRVTCKLGCLNRDNFEWRTSVQVLMLASLHQDFTKGAMEGDAHQYRVVPSLMGWNSPDYVCCRSICLDRMNPLPM